MARVQKLYARLDAIEAEILERLVVRLRLVANGRNTLFFHVGAFSLYPPLLLCAETEALLVLADEAKAIREKIGEPFANAIGERLRDYCRKSADILNANRLGPIRLARQFLEELGESPDAD